MNLRSNFAEPSDSSGNTGIHAANIAGYSYTSELVVGISKNSSGADVVADHISLDQYVDRFSEANPANAAKRTLLSVLLKNLGANLGRAKTALAGFNL